MHKLHVENTTKINILEKLLLQYVTFGRIIISSRKKIIHTFSRKIYLYFLKSYRYLLSC